METLEGTIESVLFFNPENGYSVFRFKVEGQDKIVIVGSFPPLSPGERLRPGRRIPSSGRSSKSPPSSRSCRPAPRASKNIFPAG
jgi:hypothetical protein